MDERRREGRVMGHRGEGGGGGEAVQQQGLCVFVYKWLERIVFFPFFLPPLLSAST